MTFLIEPLLLTPHFLFCYSCIAVKKIFNIYVREKGEVQSPGFPDSSYPPNVYLQWRLRADPGYRIQLDFNTLILDEDCQQDFVRIYDSLAPIEYRVLTEWGTPLYSMRLHTLCSSSCSIINGGASNWQELAVNVVKAAAWSNSTVRTGLLAETNHKFNTLSGSFERSN